MTVQSVDDRAPAIGQVDSAEAPTSRNASASLADRYRSVRRTGVALCEPLKTEDYVVQSMPNVSPVKWHLAHVTWFFETFVLEKAIAGYQSPNPQFRVLFNSYYKGVGAAHARPQRGLLTRPTVEAVFQYRRRVDDCILRLLTDAAESALDSFADLITLGLHHEQQHQELMLSDIKHVLSCNPLRPVYRDLPQPPAGTAADPTWHRYDEGLREIGHRGGGFAYDNESPRHRVFIDTFELASRSVSNGEFIAFIEDRGYQRPELWLSDGWDAIEREGWQAPMHWERDESRWRTFTLGGMREVHPAEPVCHVSYYEADAFARWAGARLPTEAEWEIAAGPIPVDGNLLERGALHPAPLDSRSPAEHPRQMYGDVWEWTASPYVAYPGFRPAAGVIGEYNGKFMCNQFVLRGGSCFTSKMHIRTTYRNFFPPEARWQMTGFRLARDVGP